MRDKPRQMGETSETTKTKETSETRETRETRKTRVSDVGYLKSVKTELFIFGTNFTYF